MGFWGCLDYIPLFDIFTDIHVPHLEFAIQELGEKMNRIEDVLDQILHHKAAAALWQYP